MNDTVIASIRKMEHDIRCCVELDWEVNLAGNGTNPGEASNCLNAVLSILGLERIYPTEDQVSEYERSY